MPILLLLLPATAIIKLRSHRHHTLIGTARHMLWVLLWPFSQRTFAWPNNLHDAWHCAMQAGGSSECLDRATVYEALAAQWFFSLESCSSCCCSRPSCFVVVSLRAVVAVVCQPWIDPPRQVRQERGVDEVACRRPAHQPLNTRTWRALVFNIGQIDACVIRSCCLTEKKTYLAEQVDVGVGIAPAPK